MFARPVYLLVSLASLLGFSITNWVVKARLLVCKLDPSAAYKLKACGSITDVAFAFGTLATPACKVGCTSATPVLATCVANSCSVNQVRNLAQKATVAIVAILANGWLDIWFCEARGPILLFLPEAAAFRTYRG